MEIFNTNRTLFYKLFSQHVVEFMPIVYDPTIADTIENYSELFVDSQYAVYLSIDDPTKNTTDRKSSFNWKKLLSPPLLGFLVALVFLLLNIPVPTLVDSTLSYVGGIVTPLSLIYIGIVLADAGLKSIRFDKDTILALLRRFILAPAVMALLIIFGGGFFGGLPSLEAHTLIVQASAPALAVLPILANEAHGDVKYATNVVTTSTVLFVVVVPIVVTLLQYM